MAVLCEILEAVGLADEVQESCVSVSAWPRIARASMPSHAAAHTSRDEVPAFAVTRQGLRYVEIRSSPLWRRSVRLVNIPRSTEGRTDARYMVGRTWGLGSVSSRSRATDRRSRERETIVVGALAVAPNRHRGRRCHHIRRRVVQRRSIRSDAVPNLSGSWTISSVFDNVPPSSVYRHGSDTVTFKRTAPNTYTVTVGSGGATSNVVITGHSFTLWSCGASAGGATYSQQDEGACPSTSGHWLEPWHLDFKGAHYTATGTFQEYAADGSTTDLQYGTFKAVGPKRRKHHG